MTSSDTRTAPSRKRERSMPNYATLGFAVIIALLGATMMTVSSSGQMKGAAMLWLPAALQLMAGVWLGPIRGGLAGGLGAYAAGVLAYGGWGPVDIIMNLVAGGVANSFLPGLLFRVLRIDPQFGTEKSSLSLEKAVFILTSFTLIAAFIGLLPVVLHIGKWAYAGAVVFLILGAIVIGPQWRQIILALALCVLSCALSALIGTFGLVVGGNTWQAAFLGTGVGWFLGDTVSCLLGLYALALFTARARDAGIAAQSAP